MSVQNAYQYNFNADGSSVSATSATLSATSASLVLPVGVECVILTCTGACHFRFSIGASTAVTSDPMLAPNQGPVVVKLPTTTTAYTLSYVAEGTPVGVLNYVKIAEA